MQPFYMNRPIAVQTRPSAREILETPRIVGLVDWNLGDRTVNRAPCREIIASRPDLLIDFQPKSARLVGTFGPYGGLVALLTGSGTVGYEMRYEAREDVQFGLGRCATQIRVWRAVAAPVAGITRTVFDDILLTRFDTVVSDREQTADGVRFWQSRLADAHPVRTVGLIRGDDLLICAPGENAADWMLEADGWGWEGRYRRARFFISNLPVTAPSPQPAR